MPSSVVSRTTASSACFSGLTARVESSLSRRARSAVVASCWAPFSALRRRARSSADAVKYTFRSASGATTAPMSRPSTTIRVAPAMMRCCSATSRARTAPTADTADTAWVTSGPRICRSTGVPSAIV